MKIAIIGSGGREHALSSTISKSSSVKEIFCIPGNAGTSKIATNVILDINEFDKVHKFINDNSIDLVVVGPEQPLVNGIVDYLEKFNIKVFGPNKILVQKTFSPNSFLIQIKCLVQKIFGPKKAFEGFDTLNVATFGR